MTDSNLKVIVTMARDDVFPWQNGNQFEAVLKYTPSGPGDVFVFDVPNSGVEGLILNGNSPDFVGFHPVETDIDHD